MKKYMQNRKLITYKCEYCNKDSEKPQSEYNRNISLNRKNYCSRKCSAKGFATLLCNKNFKYDISQHSNNRRDNFSGFKLIFRVSKKRFKDFNITLEDLKEQWDFQKGICPYSGVSLLFPNYKGKNNSIYTASLDRIDSSKGYIKGNIQFTSQSMNYMKNNMCHEDTIKLCKIIALHNLNIL